MRVEGEVSYAMCGLTRAMMAGFGIAEVQSAEALLEAMGPWAGTYLDFETCPIVEMDQALPLFQKSIQFRRGG